MERIFRTHDDCDGDYSQGIEMIIDPMGDVYVSVHPAKFSKMVRFRNCHGGGGCSPRTHAALLALVAAIKMDNQERPF